MPWCQVCRGFNIQEFGRKGLPTRGYSYNTVRQAAAGCEFCGLLLAAFSSSITRRFAQLETRSTVGFWFHFRADRISSPPANGLGIHSLVVSLTDTGDAPHTLSPVIPVRKFHLVADSETPAFGNGDIVGRSVNASPTSEDHVANLIQRIAECNSLHSTCAALSMVTLPTRYIEVIDNAPDAEKFVLRETDGQQQGAYIALSHRWAADTALSRTIFANIENRKQGKDFESLTKTFKDALKLAITCGVRFVWIDSVCIIQDSDEDWQREARKMARYYHNAYLTIAATSASADHGLYSADCVRSSPDTRLARLPYRDYTERKRGYFYVYEHTPNLVKRYQEHITDCELLSRGWVFQEWTLSRRLLYFTPLGTFLQCEGALLPANEHGEYVEVERAHSPPANSDPAEYAANWLRYWYDVVDAYSSLHLTDPTKDRVMALAGVADGMRHVLQSESTMSLAVGSSQSRHLYAAGLWFCDLWHGLLWEQRTSGPQTRVGGMPTWSWTSILGPVAWDHATSIAHLDRSNFQCKIMLITARNGSFYSFSQPSSRNSIAEAYSPNWEESFHVDNSFASLKISGRLQPVFVREAFENTDATEVAANVTDYDRGRTGRLPPGRRDAWRKIASPRAPSTIGGWGSFEEPDLQSDESFRRSPVIFALYVAKLSSVAGSIGLGKLWGGHQACAVVFVREAGDGALGEKTFCRVGVGRLFGKEMVKGFTLAQEVEMTLV